MEINTIRFEYSMCDGVRLKDFNFIFSSNTNNTAAAGYRRQIPRLNELG